jgi:hypothetical protein
LADKLVKILVVYLLPSRPHIGGEVTACFGRGLPVLLTGDLNAKHVEWNSWLSMRLGKLLSDYADMNSCLIFGQDSPTTNPYNPSASPDVLDVMITKDLPSLVHLTSCSALISDHLPVIIDTMCRSSFLHPLDRSDFRRTDWANFQSHLEAEIPFNPELHNEMAVDTCIGILSGRRSEGSSSFHSQESPA